jgi:hypothetical protein
VADSPFYRLGFCAEYLDIPRSADSLKEWTQEKERQGMSGAAQEQYGRNQVHELRRRLQQGLFSPQESNEPKARLVAVCDADEPYFLVDGVPYAAAAVVVHFVARLIEANGEEVSFSKWVKDNEKFEGEQSNRVREKIPAEVREFVNWPGQKGRSPSINRERLYALPNV